MDTQYVQHPNNPEHLASPVAPDSAVSWCAVFAGAVASAALSLILLFLGTGFGLTLVSPWSNEGISATTFSITSIVGITVISLLASALGGYMAGRLRTRWLNTPRDEVFFRDTAHGFLSWSVATLGTAALLTTVIGTIIGGGVKAGAAVASGATDLAGSAATAFAAHHKSGDESGNEKGMNNFTLHYLMDSLMRKDTDTNGALTNSNPQPAATDSANTDTDTNADSAGDATTVSPAPMQTRTHQNRQVNIPRGEITRIFINAVSTGSLPEKDLQYVSRVVSEVTGVDQQTAERRVAETFSSLQTNLKEAETNAREAADKARKASATVSLWFFISLLSGAFIASLMAVYGGRQRDL